MDSEGDNLLPKRSIIKRLWWLWVMLAVCLGGAGTLAYLGKQNDRRLAEEKKQESVTPTGSTGESPELKCPGSLAYGPGENDVTAEIDGTKRVITQEQAGEYIKYCVSMTVDSQVLIKQEAAKSSTKETAKTKNEQSTNQGSGGQEQSSNQNQPTQSQSTSSTDNSNQNSSSDNQQTQSQTTVTPSTLALGLIITPYVSEDDVLSVNEAFSLDANNPYWGFWHPGVDFMVNKDIDVQAAYGGTIENLETKKESNQMGWHTGFCINNGTENSICYNLETFSQEQSVGDRQVAALRIQNGSKVNQGDILGQLIYGGEGAHIDFGVTAPGTRVCPEPYFTEAARTSVLNLIHKTQPTWPMCY